MLLHGIGQINLSQVFPLFLGHFALFHACLFACFLVVFGSSICSRGVFLLVVLVPRVATGKESTCRSRVPMTADGIRLTPNPFACLAAEREMEEDRSPDTPTYLASPADNGPAEVSFRQLEAFFNRVPLPRDNELKEKFDMGSNLLLGDPLPLRFQDVPVYETRAPSGSVGWNALFSHLISLRDQLTRRSLLEWRVMLVCSRRAIPTNVHARMQPASKKKKQFFFFSPRVPAPGGGRGRHPLSFTPHAKVTSASAT